MTERTAVYRFYDADDRLLYVGITANTKVRWAWHKGNAAWWPDQRRVEVVWRETREQAAAEEHLAIRTERPAWNRSLAVAPGRAPYSPPNDDVAAKIDQVVELAHARRLAQAEYRAALVALAAPPPGDPEHVPINHIAERLDVVRKTVYRHLGRSMS